MDTETPERIYFRKIGINLRISRSELVLLFQGCRTVQNIGGEGGTLHQIAICGVISVIWAYVVAYVVKKGTLRHGPRPRNSKNLGNLGLNDALFSRPKAPVQNLKRFLDFRFFL